MSVAGFEPELLATLARIELLQGIPSPESAGERSTQRRSLYETFGTKEDRWVDRARAAYMAMSRAGDFVASVGDQLLCELDIREHAELYAAIGGFHSSEITHGLGAWWSPSARWFLSGSALAASANLEDPVNDDFAAITRLLLDAGADNLASFFARIAEGSLRLAESGGRRPWRRRRRRQFLLLAEIARMRGLRFRDGPDDYGRYLSDELVNAAELVAAVGLGGRAPRSGTAAETAS